VSDQTQEIEELLRTGMREGVYPLSTDTTFHDRAIAHSLAVRRHRRRTRRLAAVACAAAGVVIVAGATALASHDRDNAGRPNPPPVVTTGDHQSPLAWARSLPEGAPPSLAYILNGALHQGNTTVPVGSQYAEVLGHTGEGWLVFEEDDDQQGIPADTRYGVLTPSGEFQELPPDPYRGSVQVQALSPDGRTFATGGALIDLRTRQVVGKTPSNARFASDWTTKGLLYLDSHHEAWLWNKGSAPVPIDASSYTSLARNAAVVVTARHAGCGRVSAIQDDGSLQDLYTACGDHAPISISPDGRLALTRALGIVDVDSGSTLGRIDMPAEVAVKWWRGITGLWWENDHTVLLSAIGSPPWRDQVGEENGYRPAVVVRCDVSSLACQQAGPELSLDPSTALDLK
jgi:hypothetical protein